MLRAAYKYDFGQVATDATVNSQPLYTGLSFGATLNVPTSKKRPNSPHIALDYAYRTTKIYQGTHNLSIRINLQNPN